MLHGCHPCCQDALSAASPFGKPVQLDKDLQDAIQWTCARHPELVRKEREELISQIEETGRELRRSGVAAAWFEGVDKKIVAVSQEVNGPLLQVCALLSELALLLPNSLSLTDACRCHRLS